MVVEKRDNCQLLNHIIIQGFVEMQSSGSDFDYNSVTNGIHKVPAMLLALGGHLAARLLSIFPEDDIKTISSQMAQTRALDIDVLEQVCCWFIDKLGRASGIKGGLEATENMLRQSLASEHVAVIMEEIGGPAGHTTWDKLNNVNAELLSVCLRNEHPQTASVILTLIRPEHAAKVLSLFSVGFAIDIALRILRMEPISKDILERVEKILKCDFITSLSRNTRREPHLYLANIFNHIDISAQNQLLVGLAEGHRTAAERIKSRMFTFDDLHKLSEESIRILISKLDRAVLCMAMKGADDSVQKRFIQQMSDRAAKMLQDDIQSLGPTRVRDVDNARSVVVATARALASDGLIDIRSDRANEYID